MNEVLIHVKSRFDGSVQPARCKHCKFLQTEFDLNDNISFFGFCSFFHARKVRGTFACSNFNPKDYVFCIDKCHQLNLFDND